uniref:Putative peptidoglycan binding protein n=1 Tax=viral metagenome TaxID=1070528 RepID=A0A6H1ZNL3_9ZZZZ
MKYLGTHHDTGKTLPTVGNAIWLSFYIGQYEGDMTKFLFKRPCDAGDVQKDICIDKRTYLEQLVGAKGVDLIILCVRCLQDEVSHFRNYYCSFSQQLVEYVYKLGYRNVKVELFSEPIELIKPDQYILMLKELRKALDHYRRDYNLEILAGAGDLHIKTHRKYYKYLKDNAFHDFDAWSIHCINDPEAELLWSVKNLGDKPIHITEFTMLDYILAHGANASWTLNALSNFLVHARAFPKIKSLFQVFPARISGKYESWSVHNSGYLTRLKEFYNKYIKEVNMGDEKILVRYGDKGIYVNDMQWILKELGYDPVYIDGIFGDLTLEALNDFQKCKGLDVNEYFDLYDVDYIMDSAIDILDRLRSIIITRIL